MEDSGHPLNSDDVYNITHFGTAVFGLKSPRVQYELDAAMAARLLDSGLLSERLEDWIWCYVRLLEMDESATYNYRLGDHLVIQDNKKVIKKPLTFPPPRNIDLKPINGKTPKPEERQPRRRRPCDPRLCRSRSCGDAPVTMTTPLPTPKAKPKPEQQQDAVPAPAAQETALPTQKQSASYAQKAKVSHLPSDSPKSKNRPPPLPPPCRPRSRPPAALPRSHGSRAPVGTGVRFTPQDDDEGRLVQAYLSEQAGLSWYAHARPEDRSLKVAIRGLPMNTQPDDITRALAEKGFEVEYSRQIRARAGRPAPCTSLRSDEHQTSSRPFTQLEELFSRLPPDTTLPLPAEVRRPLAGRSLGLPHGSHPVGLTAPRAMREEAEAGSERKEILESAEKKLFAFIDTHIKDLKRLLFATDMALMSMVLLKLNKKMDTSEAKIKSTQAKIPFGLYSSPGSSDLEAPDGEDTPPEIRIHPPGKPLKVSLETRRLQDRINPREEFPESVEYEPKVSYWCGPYRYFIPATTDVRCIFSIFTMNFVFRFGYDGVTYKSSDLSFMYQNGQVFYTDEPWAGMSCWSWACKWRHNQNMRSNEFFVS
ncbi:hypothetical protein evm_014999 [Chilo suppressalis]|nr:hypothetical protein evm_014999 [Chilo suppressalis]